MKNAAEEQAAKVAQEAAATIEEMVLPSTKVTFSAGVTVQRVLTGCETCRVLVKNLPLTATKAEVIALFTQPGFDPTKFTVYPPRPSPTDKSHLEAVVEFEHLEDGKNAVAGLDEIEFGSETVKLVLIPLKQGGMGKSKDLDAYILTVTWPAPSNTVFASYFSLEEARSKRAQLEKKTFNGKKIRANIAKKPQNLPDVYWNHATISVNGLDPGTPLTSIQEFCGTTSIRIPPRNTRSYNLDEAIPTLQSLVLRAHPQGYNSVTYEPNLVPNERGVVSAKIHFPTWEHAKAVRDFLDQKPLPFCAGMKYFTFLPDPLHYTMHVPRPQYKAQEKLFQSLIPTPTNGPATTRLRILTHQPGRPARIELSGSDKKTVGRLKVRIEQLTSGEKLPQWNRVFYGVEGERILTKVNNESRAYIRVDKRQSTLKAFGEPAAVERAKAMIQEEVDRLESLQFEVFLKRDSVRFFVNGARGSTLLKQEVGEENVMLDVSSTPCKIVVRGGEPARHFLGKLIDESLSDAIRSQHQLKDAEETCPVCYDTIDQPYRLACGHAYCHGCLRHFLSTACDTKQFPLLCMGNEGKCGVPVPLPVIQRFLVPAQVKHLLEVSFLDHLDRHPDKFKYCTTPDCPEIYSLETEYGGGIFRCRLCFVSACVTCGEDHEGFGCEEWKIHRDPEAQERMLEGWAEGSRNVKKCPECNILIEKNGGCNHMTCPKCRAHICWRCMGVFTADSIYDHMNDVHGGMLDGLDEPVQPIRPVQPFQPYMPYQPVQPPRPAPLLRPNPPPRPFLPFQPPEPVEPAGFFGWLRRLFH